MPALIALVTQVWFRERCLEDRALTNALARLMNRAHALGAENPLAACYGRPEPIEAYFDAASNQPVATPRLHFESRAGRPEREGVSQLHGAEATVEAATTTSVSIAGAASI